MIEALLRPFLEYLGSAAHALGGLAIFAWSFLLFVILRARGAHWLAAAIAIGFYWGRETRDHENRLDLPTMEVWTYSWMPWGWSVKGIADLVWPMAAVLAVVAMIELLRKRRGS